MGLASDGRSFVPQGSRDALATVSSNWVAFYESARREASQGNGFRKADWFCREADEPKLGSLPEGSRQVNAKRTLCV